ncbi:MAG: hypothetical protein UZ16_OP3001000439 [Candidatus Hinthialibacteria bacterium OLB16]|nr:MAG: hypothetical protein UZ16_OP3001000439 [Candidatus Hinthialibacteria bacterium OLB16]
MGSFFGSCCEGLNIWAVRVRLDKILQEAGDFLFGVQQDKGVSGFRAARGIPGNPPPVPRSRTRPVGLQRAKWRASESRTCLSSHFSSGTRVRLWIWLYSWSHLRCRSTRGGQLPGMTVGRGIASMVEAGNYEEASNEVRPMSVKG